LIHSVERYLLAVFIVQSLPNTQIKDLLPQLVTNSQCNLYIRQEMAVVEGQSGGVETSALSAVDTQTNLTLTKYCASSVDA
jgi:hypothetical protein